MWPLSTRSKAGPHFGASDGHGDGGVPAGEMAGVAARTTELLVRTAVGPLEPGDHAVGDEQLHFADVLDVAVLCGRARQRESCGRMLSVAEGLSCAVAYGVERDGARGEITAAVAANLVSLARFVGGRWGRGGREAGRVRRQGDAAGAACAAQAEDARGERDGAARALARAGPFWERRVDRTKARAARGEEGARRTRRARAPWHPPHAQMASHGRDCVFHGASS